MRPQLEHSLPYAPCLDGVRGLAILLVVAFHAFPKWVPFGFVGVDIFFVLSGFLITRILVRRERADGIDLLRFYRNRIRRIFPAAMTVLSVNLLIGYLFLFPQEFKDLSKHVVASALFFQNFQLIGEIGYWDKSALLKPTLHYWSLSIEEQFYAAWPVVLIASLRWRFGTAVLGAFVTLLLLAAITVDTQVAFYHPAGRFCELLIGAACVYLNGTAVERCCRRLSGWSLWAVLAGVCALFWADQTFILWKALILCMVTGALILRSLGSGDRLLESRTLVSLGIISFSLYLWHYSLFSYAHIFGWDGALDKAVLIGSSICLAWLTFRFVEAPGRRQRNWRPMGGYVVIGFAVAAIGQTAVAYNGMPWRPHMDRYHRMVQQLDRTDGVDRKCENFAARNLVEKRKFDYCRATGRIASTPTIIVMGDSHAHTLFPGVSNMASMHGDSALLLANTGCPPFPGMPRGSNRSDLENCQTKIRQIYRLLQDVGPVRHIILATRGPKYIYEEGFGKIDRHGGSKWMSYFREEGTYDPAGAFYQGTHSALQRLAVMRRPITLLLENPELGFSPRACLSRPLFGGGGARDCRVSRRAYEERMGSYRVRMKRMVKQMQRVHIADPESLFCDHRYCRPIVDGKMMYADDDHLSVTGSVLLTERVLSHIY